jgi:imidazole glycerol phosphate synthase glutamine amidotransferase subunit
LSKRSPPKVTIFDYGVGNLHSISKALELGGAKVQVVNSVDDIIDAEIIVFPGVGDFGAVMSSMDKKREALMKRLAAGVPTLGICIGFQILFEASEEARGKGLGLLKGKVEKFKGVRIPHTGWNTVEVTEAGARDPLMKGIPKRTYFYFANSYAPAPKGKDGLRIADSDYGRRFPSVMRKTNTYGTQFHPEKSGTFGLRLIRNFVRFAAKEVEK